jgi:WD40 repeat protein
LQPAPHATRHRPPPPPRLSVTRTPLLTQAKMSLLNNSAEPFPCAVLAGAPGYGKTTLALQLCADDDICAAFSDGVIWVSLAASDGQSDLLDRLCDVYTRISNDPTPIRTLEQASLRLRDVLAYSQHLLVVDNIWYSWQLEPWLTASDALQAFLFTTRDRSFAPARSHVITVGPMASHELEGVVAAGLESTPSAPPWLLPPLAGWPLLASLVNAFVRAEVRAGASVFDAFEDAHRMLQSGGPAAFDAGRAVSSIMDGLMLQIDGAVNGRSSAKATELLGSLAIFPAEVEIPVPIVVELWNRVGRVTAANTASIIQRLGDMHLIRRLYDPPHYVQVHDVFRTVLGQAHAHQLRLWNEALITSWHQELPHAGRWSEQATDVPYRWNRLAYHLAEAGMHEELVRVLRDDHFLARQSLLSGAYQIDADFAMAMSVADATDSARLGRLRSRYGQISHLAARLPTIHDIHELILSYVVYGQDRTTSEEHPATCEQYKHLWQPPDLPHEHLVRAYEVGHPGCKIEIPRYGDNFYVVSRPANIDTWSFRTGSRIKRNTSTALAKPFPLPESDSTADFLALGGDPLFSEIFLDTFRTARLSACPDGSELIVNVVRDVELWDVSGGCVASTNEIGAVAAVDWSNRHLWCETIAGVDALNFDGVPFASIEMPEGFFGTVAGVATGSGVTVAVSALGRVYLFDEVEGHVIWTRDIEGDTDETGRDILFSHDESKVVVGSAIGPGLVLCADSGKIHALLEPSAGDVAVGPGDLVAYSYEYRSLRVLAQYRDVVVDVGGFPETITSIAFSPDGSVVVVGGFGGYVVAVRLLDGAVLFFAREHTALISSVSFRQDGTCLSVGADGYVRTWSIPSTPDPVPPAGSLSPIAARFTADRTSLLCVADGGALFESRPEEHWNLSSLGTSVPQGIVDFGPIGIASVGRRDTIFVYAGNSVCAIGPEDVRLRGGMVNGYFSQLEIGKGGSVLYTVSSDQRVCAWNAVTLELEWEVPAYNCGISSPSTCTRICATDSRVYSLGLDGVLRVYDAASGVIEHDVRLISGGVSIGDGLAGTVLRLEVLIDGVSELALGAGIGPRAAVYTPESGTVISGPTHSDTCSAVTWSPRLGCCVSGGEDGVVAAWDLAGRTMWSFRGSSPVAFLAASSRVSRVAAGCHDGSIAVLDEASGVIIRTIALNGPALDGCWAECGEVLHIVGPRGHYGLLRTPAA